MRLLLTFRPLEDAHRDAVTKHTVQGLIYSHLWGTEYWRRHDEARFKFFTFSDIFPPGDFRAGEEKSLLISSPDGNFIEILHERLGEKEGLYLGGLKVELVRLKKFSLRPNGKFVTGSPVVVRSMNLERRGFFSFYHEKSLNHFITRITENALKKYRVFTGEEFELDGPIFDRIVPRVRKDGRIDVYTRVRMHGASFLIPGSTWKLLEKRITPTNRDFYAFLMDAGMGELNSLGFGFLNPIKKKGPSNGRGKGNKGPGEDPRRGSPSGLV
ncbi:CRISPR-associated endoribonuclease Cas6 [Thermococcus sp. 18S1]|uniref:CRISPR-associated endoribonuclease Cas6 n=1 Tax=Thermococcus sp. 18S1 TaxID=1638210 RepID=UPI00143A4562|nr:CRISPR-associated endoribonuclease Cas6 [Thermococcus sp. 18S1]NJE31231.1 CRISPR-associated endoribonuclease Cas6 [Thermococcus sp. 18S1]